MKNIKISVIIPIYNMEEYLEECLDSVLSQTLKELEIICIDDGSTDYSFKILEEYSKRNPEIVLLAQKNKGSAVARNYGIDIATGEFIAFMDADDFYPQNDVLEILYNNAKEQNVLICGGTLFRIENGRIVENKHEKEGFLADGLIEYKDYQFQGGYSRFIYNREFLKKEGIKFPTYRRFQDPPFFVEAMIKAGKFYAIRNEVYVYRMIDKIINWNNPEVLNGIIKGIRDILHMSRIEELECLHAFMVNELVNMSAWIYKSIFYGNEELQIILNEIKNEIDKKLLINNEKVRFSFLNNKEIAELMEQAYVEEKKLWFQIQRYIKIIIYGAGQVGKRLYVYIMEKGYPGTVEFAISNEETSGTACGKEIKCIKEFKDETVLILIAVAKPLKSALSENARSLGFENIIEVDYEYLKLFGKS